MQKRAAPLTSFCRHRPDRKTAKRPEAGVVQVGLPHIGVMRRLEEHRTPVDSVKSYSR